MGRISRPAGRFLGLLRGLPASGVDARRGQYRLFELPRRPPPPRPRSHPHQNPQPARHAHAQRRSPRARSHLHGRLPRRHRIGADPHRPARLEGHAAALYFEQFESMLKQREDWKFDWRGRNRRPPRDPVNALLSLGYSMLAKELTGVCHAVGLDPFLGFMHQPRYGRPALALDLMEEFRPLVADSVADQPDQPRGTGAGGFHPQRQRHLSQRPGSQGVLGGVVPAAGHRSQPSGIQL